MKNWKTTLCGIISAAPQAAKLFWPDIPTPIFDVISTVAIAVAFYFAKDKNTTGGTVQQ
jgi:hypothetical protein